MNFNDFYESWQTFTMFLQRYDHFFSVLFISGYASNFSKFQNFYLHCSPQKEQVAGSNNYRKDMGRNIFFFWWVCVFINMLKMGVLNFGAKSGVEKRYILDLWGRTTEGKKKSNSFTYNTRIEEKINTKILSYEKTHSCPLWPYHGW